MKNKELCSAMYALFPLNFSLFTHFTVHPDTQISVAPADG